MFNFHKISKLKIKKAKRIEEQNTDKLTIKKGYARGLYLAKVMRTNLYKNKCSENYLTPKQIKSYVKKIGKQKLNFT